MSLITRSFASACQGELRVGEVQQQRAGRDVLEHEDVLALVLVGEEVPAGDDAVVGTAALTSMWYALAIATRSAARTSAG